MRIRLLRGARSRTTRVEIFIGWGIPYGVGDEHSIQGV